MLLARLLNLNDTQAGVLQLVFRIADDNGLLLLDFKDLRAMVQHVGEHARDVQQIAADNVVVIYVDHFHYFYSPATESQPIIEIVDMDLQGHALAYAFRDGQTYEVEWVYAPEEGGVLGLVDMNGEPFPLKPGTTWFQVVHDDSRVSKGDGLWRFEFIFRRP